MADTVNAVCWKIVLFGGDRSTESDLCIAIITAATREGGARFDNLLFLFTRNVSDSQTLFMRCLHILFIRQ